MRKIDKEARRLLERVLKRYYAASEWSRKALSLMIDDELMRYNKRAQEVIEPLVYKHLKDHFPTHALPPVVPTPPELSQMLYRNARQAAGQAVGLLWSAQKAGKGIRDLSLGLYEGYGFRDKEVLDVVKGLPLYLRRQMQKPTVQKRVVKQVSRLRTRPLRAAYADIVRAIENENRSALERAAKVAIEEKARYYARRIAVTEEMRAFNLANAKEILQDDEIELVRYTMSSAHPMMDICDYYANLDVGYGRGVVPKREMVSLPLHPHCRCKYEPYYRDVKRKSVRNPSRRTLERFSENQQRQILGSWEAWKKWREGASVEKIFNMARPKWRISRVVDALDY